MISVAMIQASIRIAVFDQRVRVVTLALLLSAGPGWASAQTTIDVTGLDGRATTVSLEGLTRIAASVQDRGLTVRFEGVLVRDVLSRAGVALGDELRGTALARYLLVTARDGYRVVYALAELDAGFTDAVVLLADRRDGRLLSDEEGPLRLIVPHEKRGGRWVRQVVRLEVKAAP
jgi:DMSO/TMAO reductase YedYZ molybdopterin-dependent catalytic subunit